MRLSFFGGLLKKTFLLLIVSFICLISNTFAQKIITTFHPYYSLVKQVAPEAEVINLLPAGSSPHYFDPSPGTAIQLNTADLVILNGVIDEWIYDLVKSSGSEAKVIKILELATTKPILGSGQDNYDSESHDEHETEGESGSDHEIDIHAHGDSKVNSHIWLDPVIMMSATTIIAGQLIEIDEANAESYIANARNLVSELTALDKELQELLKPVRGAAFVPFHSAWPYFARRYRLNLVVEIEPSPGQGPTARYLAYALAEIEESGATAIFNEVQLSARAAEVVAEEAGIELFLLDPIGGGEETKSYQDLLRYNANIIAEALK